GWLYGLGFFVTLLWWIAPTVTRFGGLHPTAGGACLLLLCAYLALYPALGAAGVALARSPAAALALAPLLWAGLEGLRGWLLTGFPWGDLPQALWRVDWALALAPWVGIDGARLLLAGIASTAAWGLLRLGPGRPPPARALLPGALAAAAWAALAALPSPVPPPAGELRVAVVQGNIDQSQKWDPVFRQTALRVHTELSRAAADGGVDLLVWPETSVPFFAQDPSAEREGLEALAQESGAHLLFGAPAYELVPGGYQYRNAVFLMDPGGRIAGRYDKVHLVPFGEYVPFGRYLPFLKKLAHGAGDFTAGAEASPLRAPGLPALGPLVCFEAIFPSVAAQQATRGAQVLVVVTNDGWFGATPGPYQHLAFSAWRAAELGLPLVRAANTGVSAAFDGGGRLLQATRLLERASLVTTLPYPPPSEGAGARTGPWVWPTCLALAVAGLSAIFRGSRSRGEPPDR
ncbi:MAG: apolipoprotein N-acyltransferase, partial [Deferrisomatales bacterium]